MTSINDTYCVDTLKESEALLLSQDVPTYNVADDDPRLVIHLGNQGDPRFHTQVVALRVSGKRGYKSLKKLDLRKGQLRTATIFHSLAGEKYTDLLFRILPYDYFMENNKAPGNNGRIVLGPGLEIVGRGFCSHVPDGTDDIKWSLSPYEAPVAVLPEILRSVDPIPEDEDTYSSGSMTRVDLSLETSATPPKPLFEDILLEGRVHSFTAQPGVGKSLLTLNIAVELARNKKRVVIIDGDGNRTRMADRLDSLGATTEDRDNISYYSAASLTVRDFERILNINTPALVVFDNLTNLLDLAGINENNNTAIAGWFNNYPARCRDRGVAALILDHPPKSSEGRYARGGGSKLAEEDVAWSLTQTEEVSRKKVGKIKLKREKDGDGVIEAKSILYKVGGSPLVFEREDALKLNDTQQTVLDCLEAGQTSAEWTRACNAAGVTIHPETLKRAKQFLVENGVVEEREDRFYLG